MKTQNQTEKTSCGCRKPSCGCETTGSCKCGEQCDCATCRCGEACRCAG